MHQRAHPSAQFPPVSKLSPCNIWRRLKKNRTTLINFTNFSSSLRKFAYAMWTKLANNRISNVWKIISPKKSRQFSFQLIPPMSQPCPQIIVGIKCSYHLFYVFYQTRALAWMANITLPLCSGLPPTISQALRFYANIQIISSNTQKKFEKMHCGRVQRLGEEGWWLTKQMKQLYRSLLDWAEYAYVLLFITIVITVYSIFYLFWATKPRKKRIHQINSARWPPR